mgnify:CR=1 FL=1
MRALDVSYDEPSMNENLETVQLWPTLKSPAPIMTKNKFRALDDFNPDDEDESEVLKALAALTPNVSTSSARAMSQRAKKGQPRADQILVSLDFVPLPGMLKLDVFIFRMLILRPMMNTLVYEHLLTLVPVQMLHGRGNSRTGPRLTPLRSL